MKRITIIASLAIFILNLTSCGVSTSEMMKLEEERDSLRKEMEFQATTLNEYSMAIDVLNETLDSIAQEEQMIFLNNGETPLTKDDVRQNLLRFDALLKKQEAKILELEQKLSATQDSLSQTHKLIAHLKQQIAQKNQQISTLQEEVEKANVTIADLRKVVENQKIQINTQANTISELEKRNARQEKALATQDEVLNQGYVLIATKKDLERKGIIKKGKLVSNAMLDRTKFIKVDIREWREITFAAKRPKILTNTPNVAYELTTSVSGTFTLKVLNAADFWKMSNYLVIQTD
ncbi:MAG: hypothetical protein ACI31F_02570 [Muribaculaceae bacterium]